MILHNGLVFKKKVVNFAFRFINGLNHRFRPSKSCPIPTNPRKILLSNLGNIGDLLIASKTIASLKLAYPNAEWGVLVSSRGQSGVRGQFQRIHVYDHWCLSKCKAALHSRRKAIREIRDEQYDMGIDLQPFYPNAVPLMRSAKIPVRMGYASGGFGAALTHPFDWKDFGTYLGDLHLDHLRQVGIYVQTVPPIKSSQSKDYIVVHMCSSRTEKDWKRERWIELIRKLHPRTIVLTGLGAKDAVECEAVAQATGCKNLCNQTSLEEYRSLLQQAKGLISVDSMGVHLAALLHVPRFVLFSETESLPLWLPPGSHVALLREDPVEKIVDFVHTQCR